MSSANGSINDEPPLDSPERRRLPLLLRRAWYGLNQAFRRRLVPLGITPDQFTVIRWLMETDRGGITQRRLTTLMASDPNTVTSVLNRMESSRLIERRAHERDRRAKRVRLTEDGVRAYHNARRVALDLQAEVLEALSDEDREKFLAQLEAVADACQQAAGESARREERSEQGG